jgi:hypothetical protein
MYCRRCETPREPAHPGPIWGADRISGLRCGRCGALLGAEDIVRLLLAKQSQLEQFGMLEPPHDPDSAPPQRALRVLRLEKD